MDEGGGLFEGGSLLILFGSRGWVYSRVGLFEGARGIYVCVCIYNISTIYI